MQGPAKDSHSIGEADWDGHKQRICFHKIGDFVVQAAKRLRRNSHND
jgi:hypothetical protein